MNDYLLGGKDNFAADREAVERLAAIAPEIRLMAEENRRFLGRVVRYLAEQGIRQFLDLGSGLPTRQNTHEVAHSVAPDARVVYVDNDPVVISHAEAVLLGDDRTAVLQGDVLHPEKLVDDCRVHRVIDFDRPLAILIFGALHFIPHSDDPFRSVAWLRDTVASGSHLALSHAVFDTRPDVVRPFEEMFRGILGRADAKDTRNRDEVLPFFDGFELVDPGLVYIRQWRPAIMPTTQAAEAIWQVGGVGRKP